MAQEDHYYENPANWYPSYPGVKIAKDDRVVLMTDANANGYDIVVEGVLEIQLGAILSSSDGNLIIKAGGLLDNDGSVFVKELTNYGQVYNRQSAEINIHEYIAHTGAQTHNSYSATFTTIKTLVNEGRFDNYGHCKIEQTLTNVAVFNQINRSELEVAGDLQLLPGCTFNQSQKSTLSVKSSAHKVAFQDRLMEMFQ
ncbi:MAG: hypothetical protein AAF587_22945 [Bacteroidota bacterium]